MRVITLTLAASIVLTGQGPELDKLVKQAAQIRHAETSEALQASDAFKATLREWIEARLPDSRPKFLRQSPQLQSAMTGELKHLGLLWTESSALKPGYVHWVEMSRPPADPNRLAIIAGVTLGCGFLDSVYVYDYSLGARRRVLESNGSRDHDETVLGVHFSAAGSDGSRLLLSLRYGEQCGSSWNVLAYDLYRLSGSSARTIFAGEHEIWFSGGDPKVRLSPDDLRIELSDRSIDGGVHNRIHVLHYRVDLQAVRRIDPVALQPQDFVDEWLTRPWAEMEARTAGSAKGALRKWHNLLHTETVFGDYAFVQQCTAQAHHWQIAINLNHDVGALPSPTVFFLVHELGRQHFEMLDVSSTRQQGCHGESPPKLH